MDISIQRIKNPMHSRAEMLTLVHAHANLLKLPFEHDARRLLLAFADVESSLGQFNFRYEFGYGPGGLYFRRSKDLRDLHKIYGPMVSMSYGPWQIMYIVAYELGFRGHPLELALGGVSLPYTIQVMNRAVSRGAKSLKDLCSIYNGGNIKAILSNENVKHYHLKIEEALDRWMKTPIDWSKYDPNQPEQSHPS